MREIVRFLEDKFENRFSEETRIVRAPGIAGESIIHCVFLVLDPVRLDANMATAAAKLRAALARQKAQGRRPADLKAQMQQPLGALNETDLMVFRIISRCSTVIPIIGKADTVTRMHMEYLKKAVRISLKRAGIDVLEKLSNPEEEDEEDEVDVDEEMEDKGTDEIETGNSASEKDRSENSGPRTSEEWKSNSFDRPDSTSDATPSVSTEYTSLTSNNADGSQESRSDSGSKGERAIPTTKRLIKNTSDKMPKGSTFKADFEDKRDRNRSTGDRRGLTSIKGANKCNELPLSVMSPDPHILLSRGQGDSSSKPPIGRHFPWGFADPNNPSHCDFLKLKESIFVEWRSDLITVCREVCYEKWRTSRLDLSRHQRGLNDYREANERKVR